MKKKILIFGAIFSIVLFLGCIGTEKREITTPTTTTTTTLKEYTGPYKEAVKMVKSNPKSAMDYCDSLNQSLELLSCKFNLICAADEDSRKNLCENTFTKYPEQCDKLILACDSIDEAVKNCGNDSMCVGRSAAIRSVKNIDDALRACNGLQDSEHKFNCYMAVAGIVKGNDGDGERVCNKLREIMPENMSEEAVKGCIEFIESD